MKLFTEVYTPKHTNKISYDSKLLCLGSCFAEHISNKLKYYKFQVSSNPFGILFHPKAILNVTQRAIRGERFSIHDVFYSHEKWHSFYAHSKLSRNSSSDLLSVLNLKIDELRASIEDSTHIVVTLGTSFIFKHIPTEFYVANCHRVPQEEFNKELTLVEDLRVTLSLFMSLCKEINPDVEFIFTVSPVRHIKEGIVENQRSKAQLISALHSVLDKTINSIYFPSYELMMDEFRDYRYYSRDMIHPNELAIDLIWERFKNSMVDEAVYSDIDKVSSLQKSIEHIPFDTGGRAFEKLKSFQNKLKNELIEKYPFMSFGEV